MSIEHIKDTDPRGEIKTTPESIDEFEDLQEEDTPDLEGKIDLVGKYKEEGRGHLLEFKIIPQTSPEEPTKVLNDPYLCNIKPISLIGKSIKHTPNTIPAPTSPPTKSQEDLTPGHAHTVGGKGLGMFCCPVPLHTAGMSAMCLPIKDKINHVQLPNQNKIPLTTLLEKYLVFSKNVIFPEGQQPEILAPSGAANITHLFINPPAKIVTVYLSHQLKFRVTFTHQFPCVMSEAGGQTYLMPLKEILNNGYLLLSKNHGPLRISDFEAGQSEEPTFDIQVKTPNNSHIYYLNDVETHNCNISVTFGCPGLCGFCKEANLARPFTCADMFEPTAELEIMIEGQKSKIPSSLRVKFFDTKLNKHFYGPVIIPLKNNFPIYIPHIRNHLSGKYTKTLTD